MRGKVNLYSFLQDHEYLNDFELGWFLHLITDYLFFEECFDTEYLLENSYEQFCKDLYFAYNHLNLYPDMDCKFPAHNSRDVLQQRQTLYQACSSL